MAKWRKLWADRPGSSFQHLPEKTKGLAARLLLYADDDGVLCSIPDGLTPAKALCFVYGVDVSSRRWVAINLPLLLEDGFIEAKNGVLRIPNFRRFQADRRGRSKVSKTGRPPDDPRTTVVRPPDDPPTTVVQRSAPSARNHSPQIRQEENRIDKNIPTRAREADGDPHEEAYRALIRSYARRIEAATQIPWAPGAHTVSLHEIAGMLQRWDTGEDIETKVGRVLDAFFAHEWASENGWPPKHLAKYFAQIVAPQPKKPKQQSEFDAQQELRAARQRLKEKREREQR